MNENDRWTPGQPVKVDWQNPRGYYQVLSVTVDLAQRLGISAAEGS